MIYLELFWSFFKIGLFTFGGGYAMIPLIQEEIIVNHRWLTTEQFMDIVAISQITPGPVAINTATFVGYRVGSLGGAVAATTGVVLPSLIVMIAFALILYRCGQIPAIQGVFRGLRPVVTALIAAAVLFLGRAALVDLRGWLIGILVFLAMRHTKIHPIFLILLSALGGLVIYSI